MGNAEQNDRSRPLKANKRITGSTCTFNVFEERRDLDIQRLRQETEADHHNVEGAVPLMHQGLNTAEYVHCLQRIYGVVAAWEERAAEVAPGWLQPALLARQRRPLLELDLAWFGETEKDDRRPTLPEMNNLPSLFGTMYVMEGSTLGGQFIARHVEAALHLSEGRGNSYFRGHCSQTGPLWKEFCEMLKLRIPDEQTAAVVVSAKAMFSTFGTWMQRKSAMDGS
jgi:heme oxygenase (biliverdin-IX-beta and delta-forming)